jgi:hypothetical protein
MNRKTAFVLLSGVLSGSLCACVQTPDAAAPAAPPPTPLHTPLLHILSATTPRQYGYAPSAGASLGGHGSAEATIIEEQHSIRVGQLVVSCVYGGPQEVW